MEAGTFRDWLGNELEARQIKRRELARRLATKHPEGATMATIETYRRAIYKYLDPERPASPTNATRAAFAEALGVDPASVPSEEDEEDSEMALTRDLHRAINKIVQAKVAKAVRV